MNTEKKILKFIGKKWLLPLVVLAMGVLISSLILKGALVSSKPSKISTSAPAATSTVPVKPSIPVPKGNQLFKVAQAGEISPKIIQAEVNPADVHPGEQQLMRLVVQDDKDIRSVVAEVATDHKTITIPLKPDGVISDSALGPDRYAINEKNELVLVKPGSVPVLKAEAAEIPMRVFSGSWTVQDTHDHIYRTKFIATDSAGRSNSIIIAWKDPCGFPASGDWHMSSNNSGQACTISGVDGVEQGNMYIDSASSLTVPNGATLSWNPGRSIQITNGGSLLIASGAVVQKGYITAVDNDHDGYASALSFSTTLSGTERGAATQHLSATVPSSNMGVIYSSFYEAVDAAGGTGGSHAFFPGAITATGSGGLQHLPAGSGVWNYLENVRNEDGALAYAYGSPNNYTQYLGFGKPGFNIPSYAVITGIELDVKAYSSIPDQRLTGGFLRSSDLNRAWFADQILGTSLGWVTFGGPDQLGGVAWLPSDINGVDFTGFAYNYGYNSARYIYMDAAKITVYYDIPGYLGVGDCNDNNPLVHPGQLYYFDSPDSVAGWDYDCSGSNDLNVGDVQDCQTTYTNAGGINGCYDTIASGCVQDSMGWSSGPAPACGQTGFFGLRCSTEDVCTGDCMCNYDCAMCNQTYCNNAMSGDGSGYWAVQTCH